MPNGRAGAFEIAWFALVKDDFQFGWINVSKESIQIRRTEVLFHNMLLQVLTWRGKKSLIFFIKDRDIKVLKRLNPTKRNDFMVNLSVYLLPRME